MTYALYCINDATYGGVYYCADFTLTGAQPVWTKLTTTGLADLRCTHFQVDPDDPLNRQYVRTIDEKIYTRNGGNWTEILNKTICQAVTGVAGDNLYYLWADPTISGRVYAVYAKNGFPANDFVMKSVDYGANWTSIQILDNEDISSAVEAIGDNIFFNGDYSISKGSQVYYSQDAGTTQYQNKYGAGGSGPGYIHINPQDTNLNFANTPAGVIVRFVLAGGVLGATLTTVPSIIASQLYIPTDEAAGVMYCVIASELYTTANNFTAWTKVTLGGIPGTGDEIALTGEANQTGTVMAFGNNDSGGMWMVDSGADTTPTNRAGANYGSAPYADSLPDKPVAIYGIWFGEAPANKGVFVYSVEEDAITSVPAPANLGAPMFGDRSSWRDLDADDDGLDTPTPLADYHAQDIWADTPQRHAPWPAASGTAPVSDGNKWVATDIVTQAEMHDPVTLDSDAAVLLDLNSQEIGLDTQTANTVFAGPTTGAANEPTFRSLVASDLPAIALNDLSDVDTSGVGTGDIIYKSAGDWVDYPLGVGTNISNDGSSIKIGDIVNGDYFQVDVNTGEVQLTGEATAWEDLRVEPTVRQAAGAGVPSFEKYFDDVAGTSRGVFLYSFTDESVSGNEKEVFFTMQMPHAWKIGTDISMHVHFVPAATVNSSDIIWGLEYTWKGIGEVYGDTTIIQSSTTLSPDDANITAGKHYLAEFTDISPGTSASSLSSILIGRLFRNSSAAGDTYTNKVGLLYIDAHYQVDSFGSFEEYEKEILLSDSDGETLQDSDGEDLAE